MNISYENQRDNFDVLVKRYKAYLALYYFFNGGSYEGCTPFDAFYWQYSYHTKHDGDKAADSRGY